MISPQLLNYIKRQLLKGVPKDEIKKNLQNNGWSKEDLEDAFMLTPTVKIGPKNLISQRPSKGRFSWLILGLVLIVLLGVALLIFAFFNEMWFFEPAEILEG